MANQRLMIRVGGKTYTVAKRMAGPWYPPAALAAIVGRLCDEINASVERMGDRFLDEIEIPMSLEYEHVRSDCFDLPLAEDANRWNRIALCPKCSRENVYHCWRCREGEEA